jgi:hypothetical protein
MTKKSDKWVREDLMRLLAFCVFNFGAFEKISHNKKISRRDEVSDGESHSHLKQDFFEKAAKYVGNYRSCSAVRQFFCRNKDGRQCFMILREDKDNHKSWHRSCAGIADPSSAPATEKLILEYLQSKFPLQFRVKRDVAADYSRHARVSSDEAALEILASGTLVTRINQTLIESYVKLLRSGRTDSLLSAVEQCLAEIQADITAREDSLKEVNRYLCQTRIFDNKNHDVYN